MNITLGLVIAVLFIIFQFRLHRSPVHQVLALLLSLKILTVLCIHFLFSFKSTFSVLQLLSTDCLFLLLLFININEEQVKFVLRPIILIFLVDVGFNISLVVFGVDFFGRPSALRPGDFIPRLHGAFENPMATVAIAVTAIFIGLILHKRWLTTFGVIAVLINGTMRAPLTIILIASFWILLRFRIRFSALVFCAFSFSGLVFLVTFVSAVQNGFIDGDVSGFVHGNSLRVLAWINAIEMIPVSPWIGNHTFLTGPFEMSADTIRDYGIAEAPWLQLALDYGVVVAALDFSIMLVLANALIKKWGQNQHLNFYFVGALLSIVIFTERFYGVLYGSYIFTPICLIVFTSILGHKKFPTYRHS